MAALHGALEPDTLATLTLLAAPIDFSGRESLLNLWTDRRTFDVDAFIDAHGNCPAWFLQSCFQFMNPIRNFIDKAIAFYEQMDDPNSVANYFALERWLNDNIPVAGETFREFVNKLYQRNELVRGELRLGGRRRRPAPHHLSAAAADRQERSPGGAGVDRGHPAARRIAGRDVDGDERRARRPGRRRQGARQVLAGGDALDGRTIRRSVATPASRSARDTRGGPPVGGAAGRAKRWNDYEPVWWANRPAYRNETSRPHGDR